MSSAHQWLFGYGSLIWRPDIDYIERRPAQLRGWSRRFWQGSHDHRGMPSQPGRVVTLIEAPAAYCDGMAYLVDAATAAETFAALDHREKNGYERHELPLQFHHDNSIRHGLVYVARQDNHAFLGETSLAEMAQQIAASKGPSGLNSDYLFDLARALRELGFEDPHVFELEVAVRQLVNAGGRAMHIEAHE
ncbi:MAG: gamma-glutamylcyclotransferase [Pseudomonadales bacterium]|nr:gamma-glutamylcyclotransferase [Pseudomonadales bacterium]